MTEEKNENDWINNGNDEKIALLKNKFIMRRNELEDKIINTDYKTQEFINIEKKLIGNGFLQVSIFKKLKNYLNTRFKPFALGAIIAAAIMPQLMIESTITRSNSSAVKKELKLINENQLTYDLVINSIDPKSLANIITNKALDLRLEITSKLVNDEIILFISGFKNEAIELTFKNELGIEGQNFELLIIKIILKK